jgi:hypothetical protein
MRYTLLCDDNFHFMDETERIILGQFDSAEAAIAAARHVVDRDLSEAYKPGMTADKPLLADLHFAGYLPQLERAISPPQLSCFSLGIRETKSVKHYEKNQRNSSAIDWLARSAVYRCLTGALFRKSGGGAKTTEGGFGQVAGD